MRLTLRWKNLVVRLYGWWRKDEHGKDEWEGGAIIDLNL
jgi:hypothetical protein